MREIDYITALVHKRKELRDFVNAWHSGLFNNPAKRTGSFISGETNMMFNLLFDIVRNSVFCEIDSEIEGLYMALKDIHEMGLGDNSYTISDDDVLIINKSDMTYFICGASASVREKDGSLNTY